MRVFCSLKLTLLACCSPLAPFFTRMSACSFPNIPWWAGIHCRTALLVAATCCRALVRFGSLWFWHACRTERASERNTTCLQSWSEACTMEADRMRASVSNWSSAFQRPCLLRLSVLLGSGPVYLPLRWSPRSLLTHRWIHGSMLPVDISQQS